MKGGKLVLVVLVAGCAAPGLQPDVDAQPADLARAPGDGAPEDLSAADLACTLGTPDHCGACATVCPPGADDGANLRSCAAGACGLTCRGEFYDVDGDAANGCEAEDPTVQDSAAAAVAFANDGAHNPINVAGRLYGDARTHETAPAQRPNGREDWYKVVATTAGDPTTGMTACLGLTNFPSAVQFEVCLSDSGQSTFTAAGCKTVTGGASSVCALPPAATDAGTYYVRVRKLSGPNSALQYALFLKH